MLVGGIALAQQGVIVEPWHKAPPRAQATVPSLRDMPGSGLGSAKVAPRQPRKEPAAPSVAGSGQWSPPVLELLVDPWAKGGAVAAPARPRWVPSNVEIVDPWADDAANDEPRVATHRAGSQRSTIF